MQDQIVFKTISEKLFADYLNDSQLAWDYEPDIDGQVKKPDFRVQLGEGTLLCDVKERSPNEFIPGPRCFDPIGGIRKLIEKGRTKFKDFTDQLCAVTLYNHGDHETRLDPWCVFSAMLGEPGFQMPFDPETGTLDSDRMENVFLPHAGKMVRCYAPFESHTSTRNLSALIALRTLRIPNFNFKHTLSDIKDRYEAETGQQMTSEGRFSVACDLIWNDMPMTLGDAIGVIVCANPFANRPFPQNLFVGPYDERWEIVGGQLTRTFCGDAVENEDDNDVEEE